MGDFSTTELILQASNPTKVKLLGRKVSPYDDQKWSSMRYQVAIDGLTLKFTQNKELREALLSTGSLVLVEASGNDAIWGIGVSKSEAEKVSNVEWDWPGQNLLGQALMEVRSKIQ